MLDYEINPMIWFCDRCLPHTPIHFVISKVPLTQESLDWLYNNTTGRFSLTTLPKATEDYLIHLNAFFGHPAFENPQEAVIYELKWG